MKHWTRNRNVYQTDQRKKKKKKAITERNQQFWGRGRKDTLLTCQLNKACRLNRAFPQLCYFFFPTSNTNTKSLNFALHLFHNICTKKYKTYIAPNCNWKYCKISIDYPDNVWQIQTGFNSLFSKLSKIKSPLSTIIL